MRTDEKMIRREYLAGLASVVTVGIAGCQNGDSTGDGTDSPASAPTRSRTRETVETTSADRTDAGPDSTTQEETETSTPSPVGEYVVDFTLTLDASVTDSVIFDSQYTDSSSPEVEIDLEEMDELRRNDFDAVVEEGFHGRDWVRWRESFNEPEELQKLKEETGANGFSIEELQGSQSVREAVAKTLTYEGWMRALGADAKEDELSEPSSISDIPYEAILTETGIREATSFSDFCNIVHPIYDENQDDMRPMTTILDGESAQTVVASMRGTIGGSKFDQQKLIERFEGDVHDVAPDLSKSIFALVERSVFLPYYGKADYNMNEIEGIDWERYDREPFTVDKIAETDAAQDYWHPLRFGGVAEDTQFYPEDYHDQGTPRDPNPNDETTPTPFEETPADPGESESPPWAFPTYDRFDLEYEDAARLVGTMLRRVVTSNLPEDDDITVTMQETDSVALTQEYGFSIAREMRTMSSREDYKVIEHNAKALHRVVEKAAARDETYIIQGTLRNPEVARTAEAIDGEGDVQAVWNDERGAHNDYIETDLGSVVS